MADSGTSTLTYDAENRLTAVSGATSASFTYAGDGNRVKSVLNGVTTYYVGNYFEWTGSTTSMIKYYYAGGQRVAMRQGNPGTVYFLLGDHLGSTSITANSTGSKVAELRYHPWGGTRYTSGTTPTSYQFTGQRNDATGLYFYNARYYDPSLGRFLSADSLVPSPANPQSLNRYSYVLNSPLKYTDPTGHRPCGEFCDPSEMGTTEETDLETGNTTTPLPNPVADPDPTPIPYTFTFPWWTQHTGQGRTVPMVTLEEDFWFSKIKLSHSARIEVDGTDRLRIHYDRIKIGPTTVEASGRVINKLFSYNLFEGRYVNEVNLVGYVDGWTLGIGVREDGKTMGPSTPTYSAAISQRLELDFEINLRRTAWALATVGIIYASRGSAVEGLKALPAQ